MVVRHNTHPIEQSFKYWINQYPESFHPLDLERFYIFVKCVCRYSRKPKGSLWLREEIKKSRKQLQDDVVEAYCEKFVELQEFYNALCMQIYDIE